MTFAVFKRTGLWVVAHPAAAVLVVTLGYFGIRDYIAPTISDFRKFQRRGELGEQAGRGQLVEETKESKRAPRVEIPLAPPPSTPAGQRFRQRFDDSPRVQPGDQPGIAVIDPDPADEAARLLVAAMERRTQFDLDGDGLVDGVPAAQVDAEKRARGGSDGKREAEESPADDPYAALGSWELEPTGRRGATLDVVVNTRTKVTYPKTTLHELKRFRFPHFVGIEASVGLDDRGSYVPTADRLRAALDWTPLEVGPVAVQLRAELSRRGDVLDAIRTVESRFGNVPELADLEAEAGGRRPTYWLTARVECRSLLKGDCGP